MAYKKKDSRSSFTSVQANHAPCTDNRRELLESLLQERVVPKSLDKEIRQELPTITNGLAKAYIGMLMPLERRKNPDAANEPGYYLHDGVVYEVKVSRQGHPYALVSDGFNAFSYAPGQWRQLRASERMTQKQLKKAGL